MIYQKDAVLKIEHFHNGEDAELRIESEAEMLLILRDIANHGSRVALYYDDEQNFLLTVLLDADEQGMWLDLGPLPSENRQLLLSDRITFVSVHQHVKIQFVAYEVSKVSYQGNEAFYMELPDYLLRIQRRDFFRIDIPIATPVRCTIPIPPKEPGDPATKRTVPVLNISGSGVGLLCEKQEDVLLPGKIFPDCQISLPGTGSLNVTLEVRNNVSFTSANNIVHMRAGCCFVHPDNQTSLHLLNYITKLQRDILTRL